MGLFEYLALREADIGGAETLREGVMPGEMESQLERADLGYGTPAWDTRNVAPNATDDRIRSLCRFYASSSESLQRSMRAAVAQPVASDLLYFALRSAIFALRSGAAESAEQEVFGGVLALALSNLANDDPRDDITVLHKLYGAGVRSGVDCLGVFKEAQRYCGPGVAKIFNDYYLCLPGETIGKGFSFEVISTPRGISIEYP